MVASRPGAYLDAENEDQSISQESIRNEGRASFSTQDSLLMDSPLTDWCSFSASRYAPGRFATIRGQLRAESRHSTLNARVFFANRNGPIMNLMDLSTRPHSAGAGYNQGRPLAARLTDFWP